MADRRLRRLPTLPAVALLVALLTACQGTAAGSRSAVVQLEALNASGVSGSVTLVEIESDRTRVEVRVEPAGNRDMPAHVHPGTCDDLTPQPRYSLQNVRDGSSITVVRASFGELTRGGLAVNLHRSVDDLKTYTACADLRLS